MPLLGAIVLLIQFSFAFHVLRSGRPYWWMFVIMAFPVMGCVLYYFVEVFPQSRESRKADKAVRQIIRKLDPDKGLREKAAELEACGSVDNKLALARECTEHGMHAEAIRLYQSCLNGLYANDAHILFALAEALLNNDEHAAALEMADKTCTADPKLRPAEVRLIRARSLEALERLDEALLEYQLLADTYPGEEGRWRYGALLRRLGRTEEAVTVFHAMLRNAQRQAPHYREAQKPWLVLARQSVEL